MSTGGLRARGTLPTRARAEPRRRLAEVEAAPPGWSPARSGAVGAPLTAATMLELQRSLGNRATQRVLARSRPAGGWPQTHPSGLAIQRLFKIKGGHTYRRGADVPVRVRFAVGRAARAADVAEREVMEALRKLAAADEDLGVHSWATIIELAVERVVASGDAMEVDLGAYTPSGAPSTPLDSEVFAFNRRNSGDFSAMFAEAFGSTTEEARDTQTVIRHRASGAQGTTSLAGRFMHMSGPRVLGKTCYADFLPNLPALTGLTEAALAEAIKAGLLDDARFQEILKGLASDNAREALTKTILLMHNEIIHRSSTNLTTIIGAASRTLKDESKTLSQRLQTEGKFVPVGAEHGHIGGQKMSRLHHLEELLPRLDADLQEVWRNNKRALAALAGSTGGYDDLLEGLQKGLLTQYVTNLKVGWLFSIVSS